MRKRAHGAWLLAAVLAGAGGCTVGSGAGSANGPLFVVGCNTLENLGLPTAPICYSLDPRFFAGEPIEDISVGPLENRLIIRMQHTGNRIEINDTLAFDIENTFEVERCLRGALKDGLPDWDTRQVITVKGVCTGIPWCDWSARGGVYATSTCVGIPGPPMMPVPVIPPAPPPCDPRMRDTAGLPLRPLIHFGPEEWLRASFVPLFSCNQARVSATAVDGFIDFLDFGPPLTEAPRADFKVDFGAHLQANFTMTLEDDQVLTAIKAERLIPPARIGGTLSGFFDFDLERGRAAQQFP